MSGEIPVEAGRRAAAPRSLWLRILYRLEDALIIVVLAMMVLLPLAQIGLRPVRHQLGSWQFVAAFSASIPLFVQRGTLLLGVLGGAIAARENRLLSLATTQMLPRGWPVVAARIISGSVGAVVSAMLCLAAGEFTAQERQAGKSLLGIADWVFVAAMPAGFGLIALRMLINSADGWRGRLLAALVAAVLAGCCIVTHPDFAVWACDNLPAALADIAGRLPSIEPQKLVWPAVGVLLLSTVLGGPIFAVLGGLALIMFWGDLSPISSVAIDHHKLVTHPSLPAIALFTLGGYILAEGGASQRLVRVFEAWFGWLRGGPAIVVVLACAFFTSFTGASGVTVLALGGLLMPVLLAARFSERNSLGLLTAAGSLGMLFPPCLPLMLFAIIAKQPIESIFLAGIIPGAVLVVLTAALGVVMGARHADAPPRQPFAFRAAVSAAWAAKWELLVPVVCLGALFGGIATPVEASAVTAMYCLLTQAVIHRDLKWRTGVPRVLVECGLVVGGVLLILGVAQGFTNYLIFDQVPDRAVEWVTQQVRSPLMFLLLLNVFLLIVGCLMDVYSAIVVVVPLILPIGEAFHINPLHLGIIFLANLELGFLTPPVGMNLFLSSYRFGRPMSAVCRAVLPFLAVQLLGVLLITYVPALTTWLPQLAGR